MGSRLDRLELGALASLGACLTIVATVVTAEGSTSEFAWVEAVLRGVTVGVPIAAGLYARQRPPFERFGMLLVLAGVGWFATTLAESREPVLYSAGRVAGWIMEAGLVYLVLAFPTGHVRGRIDRVLVTSTAVVVLTLYLPTVLVVDQFPVPAPWTSCHTGCPENAFMVTAAEPALVDDAVRPLRELIVVILFAAVAVRLLQRIRGATPVARQVYGPVLAIASLRLAAFAATIVGRARWPEAEVVEASVWLLALGPPLIAGAFLLGLVRWRLYIAEAMQRLASRIRTHPEPDDMREALADAFGDPSLEVAYWIGGADGRWSDATGRAISPPPAESGRCLTEVRDGDEPVAAIIHDAALRGDQSFVDSVASYAVMTLDNHRLTAEASALLDEVNESRARIQRSADDERRRIERDLHDGAQQRLVALRIRLELTAEKLNGNADAALFSGLATDVDQALDEVRSLARGIYPAPLADRGLVEALRSAALQAALPTAVLAAATQHRYPREVESAVYFCCLEALQNSAKHAQGATTVVLELSGEGGGLRFDVRDDGAGFEPRTAPAGVGMTSMRDRLAAVGGELAIVSSPGQGTHVIGTIPLGDRRDEPPETRGARGFARPPR
jgi:signal transduction histidine kinase